VMDGGEPGLSGWTVTLEMETSPGVWTLMASTTTDPTGAYSFKWLLPGNYRVNEVLPAGWYATSSLPMLVVIPAYSVSHQTEPVSVVANIGNVMYGTICGYKFEDLIGPNGEYPNGLMDENEYGVGNWEIKLEGRQVNKVLVQRTVYTNNIGPLSDIGKYVFANLLPGIYWVNETLLANWVPTTTCVAQLWLPAYPWWPVKLVQNFGNSHPADPEMNFVLKQGMNLWSSPLQLSMQMRASELAAAIGPNCQMIYKWNATTQSWQVFIPGFTPANSWKDFRLKNGEGYYVYSKTFTTFRLSGDLITTATVSLLKGQNLLGYDSLKPLTASQFVSQVGVQNGYKVQMVSMWNENTNAWQSFIPGFTPAGSFKDFTMSQGHSYMVYASGPIVVSLPMA